MTDEDRGVEKLVSHQSHNLETGSSNLPAATKFMTTVPPGFVQTDSGEVIEREYLSWNLRPHHTDKNRFAALDGTEYFRGRDGGLHRVHPKKKNRKH